MLDVGCGPGRLVAALEGQGRRALGVDVSEAAVAHTVRRGGRAVRASVFDPLPGAGRWGTALLMDGNIGIGGDPHALLTRLAGLLTADGLLLVETAPHPEVDERLTVQLTGPRTTPGAPFPWARLGTPALLSRARAWAGAWRTSGPRTPAPLRPCGCPPRRAGRGPPDPGPPSPRPGTHPAPAAAFRHAPRTAPPTPEQRRRDQQPAGREAVGGEGGDGRVALRHPAGDQREPHQEQQPGQGGRDADVVHPGRAPGRDGDQGAVGRRVQRQQHQVVDQRRAHEPQGDHRPVAVEQPHPAYAHRANEHSSTRRGKGLPGTGRGIRSGTGRLLTVRRRSAARPTWCSARRARPGR